MSHDAILILAVVGGIFAAALLYKFIRAMVRLVSGVGRITREGIETGKAIAVTLASIDAQLKEVIPKYVATGEPLQAIPGILNFQVESIRDLRTAVRALQRTLTPDAGNYQEPDDLRDKAEDEIQNMMTRAHCDRNEAMERIKEQRLWGRMGNLVGTDPNGE